MALVATVGGVGGWLVFSLKETLHETEAKRRKTQQELQQTRESAAQLESERQTLLEAYRAMEDQWEAANRDLKQLGEKLTGASLELEAAIDKRQSLSKQLQEEQGKTERLIQETHTLANDNASLRAATAGLKEKLDRLARAPALSFAELEQLSRHFLQQQTSKLAMEERLLRLSSAYNQLLEERLTSVPQPQAQSEAIVKLSPITVQPAREQSPRQPRQDDRWRARFLRELGEASMVLHKYDRAAEALQQSLTFLDDPEVHAQLALLYGRFLHNPRLARLHAAQAQGASTLVAAPSAASAHGLPRKGSGLLWQWLVQ